MLFVSILGQFRVFCGCLRISGTRERLTYLQIPDKGGVYILKKSGIKKIVRPLATALQNRGITVWYDEFKLKIGDSLRRKIDRGLAKSRFGIVVISRSFIAKGWTNYELDGMIAKSISGEQIMLPIWHDITKQEVIEYSPSLADKVARNTATATVDEIADEIASLIIEAKAGI